jgi:hypothetical protein
VFNEPTPKLLLKIQSYLKCQAISDIEKLATFQKIAVRLFSG